MTSASKLLQFVACARAPTYCRLAISSVAVCAQVHASSCHCGMLKTEVAEVEESMESLWPVNPCK